MSLGTSKRMAELRERAAKRRAKFGGQVNTGPSDIPDHLRNLQWRTETWRRAGRDA